MKPQTLLLIVLLGSAVSASLAQPSGHMMDCERMTASAPGSTCPSRGEVTDPQLDSTVTPGWMLLTAGERKTFEEKLQAAKTPNECRALVNEQWAEIERRAKATGQHLAHAHRHRICMSMQRGDADMPDHGHPH